MASFMLIARDVPQDFADVSPEDMQRIIEKYVAWGNKLEEAGKKRAGNKLRDGEGRVLRGNGGKLTVFLVQYSLLDIHYSIFIHLPPAPSSSSMGARRGSGSQTNKRTCARFESSENITSFATSGPER